MIGRPTRHGLLFAPGTEQDLVFIHDHVCDCCPPRPSDAGARHARPL
jgi:hypothetical protein